MTDNLFSEMYSAFYTVIAWVSDAWALLNSPMREWIGADFSGNSLLGWIGEVIDALLASSLGDASIIEFLFGSSFGLILTVALARFFFK